MKMYTALRKEDLDKLQKARHRAEGDLNDGELFERRMREHPGFAEAYQDDYKRIRPLLKK